MVEQPAKQWKNCLNTPMLKTNIRSLVWPHINLQSFGCPDPGLKTDCRRRRVLETGNPALPRLSPQPPQSQQNATWGLEEETMLLEVSEIAVVCQIATLFTRRYGKRLQRYSIWANAETLSGILCLFCSRRNGRTLVCLLLVLAPREFKGRIELVGKRCSILSRRSVRFVFFLRQGDFY